MMKTGRWCGNAMSVLVQANRRLAVTMAEDIQLSGGRLDRLEISGSVASPGGEPSDELRHDMVAFLGEPY